MQTYKAELPTLFALNELLVVSDDTTARIGSLTAGREWFKPWRTVTGEGLAEGAASEFEVMVQGVFSPDRLLPLVRDFVVFEDDGGPLLKKVAGYHQFHAVRAAVDETLRAAALIGEGAAVAEEADEGHYESGRKPGGTSWRPSHRCRVAHAGLRKEPYHGLLRRRHRPGTGHAEPNGSRPHGPQ